MTKPRQPHHWAPHPRRLDPLRRLAKEVAPLPTAMEMVMLRLIRQAIAVELIAAEMPDEMVESLHVTPEYVAERLRAAGHEPLEITRKAVGAKLTEKSREPFPHEIEEAGMQVLQGGNPFVRLVTAEVQRFIAESQPQDDGI